MSPESNHWQIEPHGGKLINRYASQEESGALTLQLDSAPSVALNLREESDVKMIAEGVYSPLTGFLGSADYRSVLRDRRLASGLVWTIPVTLAVSKEEAARLKEGQIVALRDSEGTIVAVLELREKFEYDKQEESERVYLTRCERHPGVQYVEKNEEVYLGGPITALRPTQGTPNSGNHWYAPAQTREVFRSRGWRRVVGFQTRNPIHRAHEYLLKAALEMADGLFVNPLVGETKEGDVPADVRMRCYEALLARAFPKDRVFLGVLGAAMRYAGPREAIFHAIMRKNFGCTHFIVGRDHAGVGNYYGTYDAQRIFDEFKPEEIGITPLFFEHTFYCRACGEMASAKTCPHGDGDRLHLSGTKVRDLLGRGERPPAEFTRPEVADILIAAAQNSNGERRETTAAKCTR